MNKRTIFFYNSKDKSANFEAYGMIKGYLLRDMLKVTAKPKYIPETRDKNVRVVIAGKDIKGIAEVFHKECGIDAEEITAEDIDLPMELTRDEITKLRLEEKEKQIALAKKAHRLVFGKDTKTEDSDEEVPDEEVLNDEELLEEFSVDFLSMSKKELKEFIEEYEVDIDIKGKKAKDIALELIAIYEDEEA